MSSADQPQTGRRALLLGLAATMATPLLPRGGSAQAPARSLIPPARPAALARGAVERALPVAPPIRSLEALLAEANLGNATSFIALDARTGREIEALEPDRAVPPASVAKAPTALYALETLGRDFRFTTRVLARGAAIEQGVLRGDLVLQGGGDPTLQTDDLIQLARLLAQQGLRRVEGRFIVDSSALPWIEQLDSAQAVQAGYNPAISGVNLNFNRVHFAWTTRQGRATLAMDARGSREVPPVSVIEISAADRAEPVYTHRRDGGRERWTVARGALGRDGSRWLPVRAPALYAGDVFRALLRERGVTLPAPEAVAQRVDGRVIAEVQSKPLPEVLSEMLRFSTNITAECTGLVASRRADGSVASLAASGARMERWLRESHGVSGMRFVDHSGLGGESRITARQMAQFLTSAGRDGQLQPLLRAHPMRDDEGREIPNHPVQARAKTGTLSFVSGLAGYARAPSGREIIFAIASADLRRRGAITEAERDNPPGASAWARRARRLQQALLERWSALPA